MNNQFELPSLSFFKDNNLDFEKIHHQTLKVLPNFSDLDFTKLRNSSTTLPILLGMESKTNYVVTDLTKLPHLLIGGNVGSGKSNWINSMILSLLLNFKPDELTLILINPNTTEFSKYNDIPHLFTPPITNKRDIIATLDWCLNEIERRSLLLSNAQCRNIQQYKNKEEGQECLPYIVIVIDEFANIMLSEYGQELEKMVYHLSQKARAVGIHLVMATERCTSDTMTEMIKTNMPSRIAFTVSTEQSSKTILDHSGAECLMGKGDFLFIDIGTEIIRLQAPFVKDENIESIVNYWRNQSKSNYIDIPEYKKSEEKIKLSDDKLDPLFDNVVQFMRETNLFSIGEIQRHFLIGFTRAERIIDQLEQKQIISPIDKQGKRYLL